MDDLELLTRFRSDVEAPDAARTDRARRALDREFDAANPRPRRPLRPRPRLRPAFAALVAAPLTAAVAVGLAIAGAFGGGGASIASAAIIHRADAALTAPLGEILHTHVEGGGFESETWQLTSPPYSFLGFKGPTSGSAPEEATNATTVSWWDPATNTIHEQPATKAGPQDLGDPLAEVKERLHTGRARVLGTAIVYGHAAYKIEFENKDGFDSQSLVAFVDQRSYRPLLLSDPQRNGQVVQLRVMTFEYLPATAANMRLLSLVARHPTARVLIGGSGVPVK